MILGSYKRIYKQDYSPTNQPDIDTLSQNLNASLQSIYTCLTNQVTFSDNINCTIQTFTTTVDKNSSPISPITLKLANYQTKINGILVINVSGTNSSTDYPTGGVFLNYSINNNLSSSSNTTNSGNNSANPLTISINKIIGLPAGKSFTITSIII